MLILSPVFVSLLQSQITAFAVQCRSFTPSLWTERSLNKSQNRQFTIITMYQVTFNPNSSRRTSLHWGRWLTGINTPLFTSYIRCFPPQWKCNFPRKTAGINNHIAMLKYDKCHRYGSQSDEPTKYQKSDIFLSDYPTCYKQCIPPSGTTQGPFRQSRVRDRSHSTAIEWSNSRTKERCD